MTQAQLDIENLAPKFTVNTEPRNGWVKKSFKFGYDGILSQSGNSKKFIQVSYLKDSECFLVVNIKYQYKCGKTTLGVYLLESEFEWMMTRLSLNHQAPAKKTDKKRSLEIIPIEEENEFKGIIIRQIAHEKTRSIRLFYNELRTLVEKYKNLSDFLSTGSEDEEIPIVEKPKSSFKNFFMPQIETRSCLCPEFTRNSSLGYDVCGNFGPDFKRPCEDAIGNETKQQKIGSEVDAAVDSIFDIYITQS